VSTLLRKSGHAMNPATDSRGFHRVFERVADGLRLKRVRTTGATRKLVAAELTARDGGPAVRRYLAESAVERKSFEIRHDVPLCTFTGGSATLSVTDDGWSPGGDEPSWTSGFYFGCSKLLSAPEISGHVRRSFGPHLQRPARRPPVASPRLGSFTATPIHGEFGVRNSGGT